MNDVDVRFGLKRVENYRLSRRGSSEQYATEPLWFAFLPANLETLLPELTGVQLAKPEREQILKRAVARASGELRPVRPVWYVFDDSHQGLNVLINQMELHCGRPIDPTDDTFLAAARELDELMLLERPTDNQIGAVLDLIKVKGNREHFFRNAGSAWLPILWERGELSTFEEPARGEDGNYYIKVWDAGAFVARSSSEQPETIGSMIIDIKTENWGVISNLARASVGLPAPLLKELLPSFKRWFETRFISAGLVGLSLIEIAGRLVDEGEYEIALKIFEILGSWEIIDGNGQA